MAKYSGGGLWLLAGVFICGVVLGVNWARFEDGTTVLWRNSRGGMRWMINQLRMDTTKRLALVVMTEKKVYQIGSLDDSYVYVELRQKA